MKNVILRRAEESDISEIYEHLHRDYVKKYFAENENREWENHKKWYKFLINSPYFLLYILEDLDGKFLGQLKFELDGETAIVSIYMSKSGRGLGMGKKAILKGMKELTLSCENIEIVLAYILEENEASIKTFEKAGFLFEKIEEYQGIEHLLYVKKLKS
ncbi:GNAT family N-acetyltransferase [uncultured Ilyobacter sp.]|uniref:GNAT family N-acetyltransferase n=1 Tax=uncultured Ilyobacter sp. TaxID=544433 RepID=UPI0029C99B8D|nr:GNAT family N-acetyltransferase [uncultured Ilyobacter sp.]